MRILLNPRTASAYGQDVLAEALARNCGLVTVHPGGYALPTRSASLVVSMNPDDGFDSSYLRLRADGIAAVVHVHCRYSYFSGTQRKNIDAALERVATGIVPAKFMLEESRARYPHVHWHAVYNGVDRSRFSVSSPRERAEFRRRHNIRDTAKLVLFTGRLENAKGLHILEQFCRASVGDDLHVLIQYPANTAKARELYQEKARQLQAVDDGRIHLWADNDFGGGRVVRLVDLLLMPSLSEVCPLVVLEAFSAGIPVVGTAATPFYAELPGLGLGDRYCRFVPFPSHVDLNAERGKLQVGDGTAVSLAAALLEKVREFPVPGQWEREALSTAVLQAGFTEEKMLRDFAAIYSAVEKL